MSSISPPPDHARHGLVVRNFLTLGAGEILSRVIGFAGTIWIARVLDTAGYGVVGYGFNVLLYFAAIGDLGMEHLGPREVAKRRVTVDVLASSMVLARLAASALIAAVMAAVGLLAVDPPKGVVLALFALALLPMGATPRWVHIGLENPGAVSMSRLIAEAVRVVLLVLLVSGPDALYRAPIAYLAGEAAGTLWLFGSLYRRGVRLRMHIDTALVRDILRRGFPLLLTNLLSLVIYNADIVLLGIIRDDTEVGLYLAGYTLINLLGVLGNTATLSILPSLSRLRTDLASGLDLYRTALGRVLIVGLPVMAGGALLAPGIIDLVFGSDYARSALVLRVLIFSIPVLLVRSVMQAALIAAGRQDRVLHTTTVAAVITIAMNLLLIPLFGMLGAAITTVAAEMVRCIVAQVFARREGYGGIPLGAAWRPLLAVLLMCATLVALPAHPIWIGIPTGGLVYGAVLFALAGRRGDRS